MWPAPPIPDLSATRKLARNGLVGSRALGFGRMVGYVGVMKKRPFSSDPSTCSPGVMHLSCDPNGHVLEISLTNEPILLPVAPHFERCELSQIEQCRGIVEKTVFEDLGRPVFFDAAVEMVMGRIAAKTESEQTTETVNGKSTSCAFAPQGRDTATRKA